MSNTPSRTFGFSVVRFAAEFGQTTFQANQTPGLHLQTILPDIYFQFPVSRSRAGPRPDPSSRCFLRILCCWARGTELLKIKRGSGGRQTPRITHRVWRAALAASHPPAHIGGGWGPEDVTIRGFATKTPAILEPAFVFCGTCHKRTAV